MSIEIKPRLAKDLKPVERNKTYIIEVRYLDAKGRLSLFRGYFLEYRVGRAWTCFLKAIDTGNEMAFRYAPYCTDVGIGHVCNPTGGGRSRGYSWDQVVVGMLSADLYHATIDTRSLDDTTKLKVAYSLPLIIKPLFNHKETTP